MELKDCLYDLFCLSAQTYCDRPLLAVPSRLADGWDAPREITFGQARHRIEQINAAYASQGFSQEDLVALTFESRPDFVFHYLALNGFGARAAPLSTGQTVSEFSYQLRHSDCGAVMGLPLFASLFARTIETTDRPLSLSTLEPTELRPAWRPGNVTPAVAIISIGRTAAILYTPGTTGNPKDCVLTNAYLQEAAASNLEPPGNLALETGNERKMNPLPLYHMNAIVNSLGSEIVTGSCYIRLGRFSSTHWWSDIADTRTTSFKYLGITIPALLGQPERDSDSHSGERVAFGACVDPALHVRFEKRFRIPHIEVWGITETGRHTCVDHEPRMTHTRACGRSLKGFEARIVNDAGNQVPDETPEELVVRHSAEHPRCGFYLSISATQERPKQRGQAASSIAEICALGCRMAFSHSSIERKHRAAQRVEHLPRRGRSRTGRLSAGKASGRDGSVG